MIPASILSERFGRGRLLIVSAVGATLLGLVVPLAPNAALLITLRGLQGAVIAGAPATAMAWLSEELSAPDLARAMGLYISGTSIGGLTGRLVPTGIVEFSSWRWALFGSACVSLFFALVCILLLPAQRNFTPKALRFGNELRAIVGHLRNRKLVELYLVAFLAMGTFVSMYNFLGFRLIQQLWPGASAGGFGVPFLFERHVGLGSRRPAGTADRPWKDAFCFLPSFHARHLCLRWASSASSAGHRGADGRFLCRALHGFWLGGTPGHP